MPKAKQPLHSNASSLNRRRLLRGGTVAVVAAAVSASANASASLAAQPTALGSAYLSTLAELRVAWVQHDGSDIDLDSTGSPSEETIKSLQRKLWAIERRILAVSAREIAHVIDKAIVAAYAADTGMVGLRSDPNDAVINFIDGALALAQIELEACHVNV